MEIKNLIKKIEKINEIPRVLSLISGYLLVGIVLLTTWSVFMRYILREPVSYIYELGGFIFLTVCSSGVSYALIEKRHIGIDLVTNLLNLKLKSIVDLFCLIVTLIWGVIVFIATLSKVMFSFKVGSCSPNLECPLFPIEIQAPIGFLIFIIIAGLMILKDLRKIKQFSILQDNENLRG